MTATKHELLDALRELIDEASELRFGQLVANLATLARGASAEAIWDVEDDELLAATRRLLANYQARTLAVA
jgi:hypothetical protein